MYSLLIKGGTVVDGSGKRGYRADVAITGDQIVAVAENISGSAQAELDAGGQVVAPGFIDIHSHTDETVFASPLAQSKLMQGVTSEVIGNCGLGLFPVIEERADYLTNYAKIHNFELGSGGITWDGLAGYATELSKLGLGPNLLPLVSHGALRIASIGFEDKQAIQEELELMANLLETALQTGAWGMSTGLIYPPGSFADTEELVYLAKVLARYNTIFASHIRGESATLIAALEEAITIGRLSGAKIEISHLKVVGQPNWGQGRRVLDIIENARNSGVDIGADQYPYSASSTSLTALVPQWAHAGGVERLLQRFDDPSLQKRLQKETEDELYVRGGPDGVMVTNLGRADQADFSGLTIAQIAAIWGTDPVQTIFRLLKDNGGVTGAVFFCMSEEDVAVIVADPQVAVGSDGQGQNPRNNEGVFTHPRSYGTFPRVLGRYVREQGLLSLESAIYKMTGLPASRLGLLDRGIIKPGFAADITVFDPAQIADRSNFTNPHQYPVGISHVLVNGQAVVTEGVLTGLAGGKVLLKP